MPAHRSRLMGATAVIAALSLAACSQPQEATDTSASPSEGVTETAADAAAPEAGASTVRVDPVSAPGVAFTFAASFRLPDDAVTEAQSRHVAACAALGQARCRVRDIDDEQSEDGPVSGKLSLLVDPMIARTLMNDAERAVADLDGSLLDSRINGTELASGIARSQADSARMGGDLARIEGRLAAPGLSRAERERLTAQANQLRGAIDDAAQSRMADEDRLASTPLEFRYEGHTGIAGIDSNRPFASAFAASADSFVAMLTVLLTLFGVLLPWATIPAAFTGIWWFARRRSQARAAGVSAQG